MVFSAMQLTNNESHRQCRKSNEYHNEDSRCISAVRVSAASPVLVNPLIHEFVVSPPRAVTLFFKSAARVPVTHLPGVHRRVGERR